MIEQLKKYNDMFIKNKSYGDELKDNIFEFCDKSSNLIISAPHSTRSFCNKKEKSSDLYTGAIVKYLGEVNGISTITRNKFVPYKALISDYITDNKLQNHYFLDVHGFNQQIDYDICLGIGTFSAKNYPYVKEIFNIIKTFGLNPVINYPKYTGKLGLTGRYQKKYSKPNVIQIELTQYLRDFLHNSDVFQKKTLPMFNEIINLYK